MRVAELGTVYRYERSGTLHGLFRVRGFTQVSYDCLMCSKFHTFTGEVIKMDTTNSDTACVYLHRMMDIFFVFLNKLEMKSVVYWILLKMC